MQVFRSVLMLKCPNTLSVHVLLYPVINNASIDAKMKQVSAIYFFSIHLSCVFSF